MSLVFLVKLKLKLSVPPTYFIKTKHSEEGGALLCPETFCNQNQSSQYMYVFVLGKKGPAVTKVVFTISAMLAQSFPMPGCGLTGLYSSAMIAEER